MSARPTDDGRVREIYKQAKAALERVAVMDLERDDIIAVYAPSDMTGMIVDAVYANVFAMLEEVSNLTFDTMSRYPNIPWDQIRGMRNRMVHEYFNFDRRYLADALEEGVPELIEFCKEYARDGGMALDGDVVIPRSPRASIHRGRSSSHEDR